MRFPKDQRQAANSAGHALVQIGMEKACLPAADIPPTFKHTQSRAISGPVDAEKAAYVADLLSWLINDVRPGWAIEEGGNTC